jgi:transcription antitermination factor NusG
METWHLLHTKPNRERVVAVQLHQRGLEVYLPLVWVNPVNPRAERQRPFFPCYFFARFDRGAVGPDLIRCAPGMRGLATVSGVPITVSDAFIQELQQRLEHVRAVTGLPLEGAGKAPLLRVEAGPFAGFEGVFNTRLNAPDRARLLMDCAQNELWRQHTVNRNQAAFLDDGKEVRS